MTIRTLRCRIRVKTRTQRSPAHADSRPEAPGQEFALPLVMAEHETAPTPGEVATEDAGPESAKKAFSPKDADPTKVADRVYDLMKQEILLGKHRRGRW